MALWVKDSNEEGKKRPGAGLYSGGERISAKTTPFDNKDTDIESTNVEDAIKEVFQEVDNGKTLIADAITDKGVETSATDTFEIMATNIRNISGGDVVEPLANGYYHEWATGNVNDSFVADSTGIFCISYMSSAQVAPTVTVDGSNEILATEVWDSSSSYQAGQIIAFVKKGSTVNITATLASGKYMACIGFSASTKNVVGIPQVTGSKVHNAYRVKNTNAQTEFDVTKDGIAYFIMAEYDCAASSRFMVNDSNKAGSRRVESNYRRLFYNSCEVKAGDKIKMYPATWNANSSWFYGSFVIIDKEGD